MQVVEVDLVHSEPREGFVDGLLDVVRLAADRAVVLAMSEAEFGGKEDLVAVPGTLEPAVERAASHSGRTSCSPVASRGLRERIRSQEESGL